jgi:hypothetical protein
MTAMSPIASPELVALNSLPKGIERFPVKDRASWLKRREPDITASVAGVLYETPFSLWAKKSGKIPPDEETDSMVRGRCLRMTWSN